MQPLGIKITCEEIEVMGHMDVKTKMRYVHATDEGRRRAVEAAGKRGCEKPATNLLQRIAWDALTRGCK
jgi:hypothetical protein